MILIETKHQSNISQEVHFTRTPEFQAHDSKIAGGVKIRKTCTFSLPSTVVALFHRSKWTENYRMSFSCTFQIVIFNWCHVKTAAFQIPTIFVGFCSTRIK